jgi:hypothetical protein
VNLKERKEFQMKGGEEGFASMLCGKTLSRALFRSTHRHAAGLDMDWCSPAGRWRCFHVVDQC